MFGGRNTTILQVVGYGSRPRTQAGALAGTALAGFLTVLMASPAAAVPGDPDPSFAGFGNDGRIVYGSSTPFDMALQADNKIVLLENTFSHTLNVTRLNQNGTRDNSFDGDGQASVVDPTFHAFWGIAVQPDGKIVAVGSSTTDDFMVVRLLATGAIDANFGTDGSVEIDFDNDADEASVVRVQPDGKIVVAGSSEIGGDFDFSIVRLQGNGGIDLTFGGDGKVTVPFGGEDFCKDMALQANGKIVLAGVNNGTTDDDWAVARLNFNGTLDAGFNGDGKATIGFGESDELTAVALQPDGKIVLTGPGNESDTGKLARLTATGALDTSFGGVGQLLNPASTCQDVAVQANGKIVTLWLNELPDGDWRFAIHRLDANGSLDATFSGNGSTFPDFGAKDYGRRLALLADGRILAQGYSVPEISANNALIRLWPDGSPDDGGFQGVSLNPDLNTLSLQYVHAMSVQPNGRLVVAGTIVNGTQTASDVGLARLLPDGSLDGTFGNQGRTTFGLDDMDSGRSVATQPDGKIVVAGYTGSGNVQFLVSRFNVDGTLDTGFGVGGSNTMDFAGGADYGYAVAIAPDGKILVAGTVFGGLNNVFGVARFNANGMPDNAFDGDGKQLFGFPGLPGQDARALVVQPDLKIIVGGTANGDFAVVRFLETGALDTSFNSIGSVVTDMGGNDAIRALALDTVGRIYAAGSGRATQDFTLAQYQPSGDLDCLRCIPGWTNGKAFADWGGAETAWAIDARDGQIVAAGNVNGALGWVQLNMSSNANPIVSTVDVPGDIADTGEFGTLGGGGVQFLFSDKVIVAGTQNVEGNHNLLLAGFETTAAATSGSGDEDEVASPLSARLRPAFPNPLVRQSAIGFDLPRAQSARIRIYDVAGRLVRTLADGTFPAGRNQTTWDATDERGDAVAAGVYYARLDAGAVRAQQSVVVVR